MNMKITKFNNLLRHEVAVHSNRGILNFTPSGRVIRSASARRIVEPIHYKDYKIQCSEIVYDPIKLPPEKSGVGLIVSAIVASELKILGVERDDIFTVDQKKRDPVTQEVTGCEGLINWRL